MIFKFDDIPFDKTKIFADRGCQIGRFFQEIFCQIYPIHGLITPDIGNFMVKRMSGSYVTIKELAKIDKNTYKCERIFYWNRTATIVFEIVLPTVDNHPASFVIQLDDITYPTIKAVYRRSEPNDYKWDVN